MKKISKPVPVKKDHSKKDNHFPEKHEPIIHLNDIDLTLNVKTLQTSRETSVRNRKISKQFGGI